MRSRWWEPAVIPLLSLTASGATLPTSSSNSLWTASSSLSSMPGVPSSMSQLPCDLSQASGSGTACLSATKSAASSATSAQPLLGGLDLGLDILGGLKNSTSTTVASFASHSPSSTNSTVVLISTALADSSSAETPLDTWLLVGGGGITVLIVSVGAFFVWWCASRSASFAFDGKLGEEQNGDSDTPWDLNREKMSRQGLLDSISENSSSSEEERVGLLPQTGKGSTTRYTRTSVSAFSPSLQYKT